MPCSPRFSLRSHRRLLALSLVAALPLLVPCAHSGVLDEDGGGAVKRAPANASTSANASAASAAPAPTPTPTSVSTSSSPQLRISEPSTPSQPASVVAPSEKAVPSEQIPTTIAPKKRAKAPTTDLSSVPTIHHTATSGSSDPYLELAEQLAQASGGSGKINVGIGNFVYEDTDLLSPYSAMLKDELGIALPKAGKFEVIARERLADLQNEGKFQAKDFVEPGTEAKRVQIEGVQGIIRGRFYYQAPNLTIYAEYANLDGGEIHKVKIVVPASEVAARIWPSDSQKQSQPELAISPQALKESTASVQDIESKVRKIPRDFPLEIHTVDGKRGYADGETVSFRVRSDHDAYIAVIDHQVDGSEILLFPNAFNSENYIAAGKPIDVPGTVKHGFEIQVSPPFGSDVVQVIACTRKEDLQKITSTFPNSTQGNPYAVRTRGMKVVAVDEAQKNTSMASQPAQWSEDHIVVSTYPKVN
jgi:curli biogenesis system outer membrane secretion channel CsgG